MRVPGCYRTITEQLTLEADTLHTSGTSSKHLFVRTFEAAAAFERLLSSTKRFAWHRSDCQRLCGDRQQGSTGASGGIWSWHIPQQSSTQLSAKSCAPTGTHHWRVQALTAGALCGRLQCSDFSCMKHKLQAQHLISKGTDALGRYLNLKQAWISPAV